MAEIRKLLEEVESKLGETLEAFVASKTVNDWCIGRQEAINYLNKNWFWRTTYAAFQIAIVTGIYALVDKRKDSATLCVIADELNQVSLGSVPLELTESLVGIRKKYETFRHKVFVHTDQNRTSLAEDFDAMGFTWDSIHDDFTQLEYALKVFWSISNGGVIPTRAEAQQSLHIYELVNHRVRTDTLKLLECVNPFNYA